MSDEYKSKLRPKSKVNYSETKARPQKLVTKTDEKLNTNINSNTSTVNSTKPKTTKLSEENFEPTNPVHLNLKSTDSSSDSSIDVINDALKRLFIDTPTHVIDPLSSKAELILKIANTPVVTNDGL